MDDKETLNRRARLRELIARCFNGKDADLLDYIQQRTGKRPNQGEMSGLQKDHGGRSFGDRKAKALTEQIGLHRRWFDLGLGENVLPEEWMDEEIWTFDGSEPRDFGMATFRHAAGDVEYVGPAPTQRWVAVVGQAKLGENGWYDVVQVAGSDGFVEAVSSDPEAYALRVVGDSMHPAIKSGWYVLVEPGREPCPSDYVAVALTDGRKMVKEFLYRTDTEIGLQSVNGGKRLTLQASEIATMHPVSNLVSPGKYRPA